MKKLLYIIIFGITILIIYFMINDNKKGYTYTATDEAIDTVDGYIPGLKKYCEEKGYKINDISCQNKK